MRRKMIFTVISVFIFCGIFAVSVNVVINRDKAAGYMLVIKNVEALSATENGPYCHNGGVGATSCSITKGVQILGQGVTSGCNVACGSGYYACCGLRCTCVAN